MLKDRLGNPLYNVKKKRTHEVLELSDKLESEYYKKFIGEELEVLVEDGFSG